MPEKKFKNQNLFEYLKNILQTKDMNLYNEHISNPEFDTDFKKFMEIKYLSMCQDPTVRQIIMDNQFIFDKMDSKIMYRFLINVIPYQKNSFIKFIK